MRLFPEHRTNVSSTVAAVTILGRIPQHRHRMPVLSRRAGVGVGHEDDAPKNLGFHKTSETRGTSRFEVSSGEKYFRPRELGISQNQATSLDNRTSNDHISEEQP